MRPPGGHGNVPAMLRRLRLLAAVALVACGGKPPRPSAPPAAPAAPATSAAPAAPVDPDAVPLPLWSAVKKGVLPNGLTYYIMKHGKPEKRAMLWLAVNAGSVQEDPDQRGLAHFDEHMAFNGTKRFPKDAIVKYLESIGMRFGADLNAYTTWEQTVYQLEVPTDQPQFLDKGLDILRDWAGDVSYDPTEVDKERGVVLEEWRLGRGANTRLFDKHAKVLFAGSRYADRITIGDPEIIKHAPRDTLYRFYKDWYRPDLLAVIVVGDVDPATIEQAIRAKFGDLRGPANERPRPDGGVPPANGTRVSIQTDREAQGTTITIANLVPHRPSESRRDYRRLVGEEVYGEILNERLSTIARRPDAPFLAAEGGFQPLVRDIDSFERFAQVKQGQVEDALRALATEVVRIERHGVTQSELDRARQNVARFISEAADTEATTDSREFTSEIVRNFLTHELMIGRVAERDLTLEMLPKITVDELNGVAGPFSGPANRVVMISAPDGEKLPSEQRVQQILADVEKTDVPAWDDKPPPANLVAKPPAPGKIVSEKQIAKIDVTEWKLSNGVRVVVKPTDYAKDQLLIAGLSPGGLATVSNKALPAVRFADSVVDVGGVGDFDPEALEKALAGKEVHVSSDIGETTESIDASGSAKDMETMFQLLYLRMTSPRRDEQEFKVWQKNVEEQLAERDRRPEVQFAKLEAAAEWKNNPRMLPPEPADIAKVDLDKSLAFYKDRFGDASDFTFVIVGAVDLAKLRPLVETYLGSLPAHGRHEREKDLGIRKVGGVVKKEWKIGEEPKASVLLDFHGDESWTRDKDRDMFILGRVLEIKLREVLREDMGGVYGVGASGDIERSPHQERTFEIRFGCDPKRVDELVKAAFGEIDKLAKSGASADYLDKVKETFLRTRETQLRDNEFWEVWLSNAYHYGDDPTIVLDTAPIVARMTSANVQAAARRYLSARQYFEAVLLPAAAKTAPAAPAPAAAPAGK